MPEGDEEVAGAQSPSPQGDGAVGEVAIEKAVDEVKEPTPSAKSPKSTEKEVKLSDVNTPPSGGWGAFLEGLSNFFAVARTTGSRAMRSLRSLSEVEVNLADKSTNFTAGINIDKLFEQALKEIYAEYGLTPPLGSRGGRRL